MLLLPTTMVDFAPEENYDKDNASSINIIPLNYATITMTLFNMPLPDVAVPFSLLPELIDSMVGPHFCCPLPIILDSSNFI